MKKQPKSWPKEREVLIGVFDIGAESIEVVLRPGTGADYSTRSGSKQRQMPCISVGADQDEWYQVVTNLLHEAKEFCDMRMGCRFVPCIGYGRDSGDYVFYETHVQHAEICARTAYLLAECLPPLAKAWKKWKGRR